MLRRDNLTPEPTATHPSEMPASSETPPPANHHDNREGDSHANQHVGNHAVAEQKEGLKMKIRIPSKTPVNGTGPSSPQESEGLSLSLLIIPYFGRCTIIQQGKIWKNLEFE